MDSSASSDTSLDRLLAATESLIYTGGIHATGIDAVVRLAGVPRKTAYRHFGNKEGLVAAALRRRDDRWMAWFIAAIRCTPEPKQRPLALFGALREWFEQPDFHGCAFLNIAGELAAPHPLREIAREHKQRLLAYLETMMREAGAEPASLLARHWLLLVDGAISVAMVSGNSQAALEAQAIAEQLLGDGESLTRTRSASPST